jgi:hypothetical protein
MSGEFVPVHSDHTRATFSPAHWPHRWCTFEEAREFVSRVRAEGSSESRAIAQERGVSRRSVSRAIRNALVRLGEYAPEEWLRYNRERKAESRRRFLERMDERNRREVQQNADIRRQRDALVEQRRVMELEEMRAELHVSSSRDSETLRKERRRELQRKLNEKNRRLAGW